MDAVQVSPWAKSTMGIYCTHYQKLAFRVGYTLVAELEMAGCEYPFHLWGLGYSRSFRRGAVSALRALGEMVGCRN